MVKYVDKRTFKKFVLKKLDKILEENKIMSQELDTLTLEVQETNNIMLSAITLIEGLAAQLQLIADDPAKILALANELNTQSEALAAAVLANTPPQP